MSEQEIFLAAVEISDLAARVAYLDKACAGNLALRQQVEALLNVHASAGDFLATPAIEQLSVQPASSNGGDAQAKSGTGEFEKTSRYRHDPQGHSDEIPLGFLTPSTKPGSLGQLGHYEVMEILGHGAFGIVLKAFDEKLHRMVAVKVMSPELASTSPPRKRFLREARAAAAIRHENVVAVHAVEEQPIPYMVMEYIPGLTLHRALEEHGPLDLTDVLRIGQQIALGLAAAHAQGLIHRDIKPANILLENGVAGRVKITDFGLARAADDASLTQSGTIAGTPMYMSPEQATTGHIDERSDLFSLGSVMYVMVSGRPPFRAATTLAVLRRVVEDAPRPIPEIIANVPSWLCVIIAKLQAKQPADRFVTANEVGELLGRCLADLQANRPIHLPADLLPAPVFSAASTPIDPVVVQRDAPKPNRRETARQRRWPTIAAMFLLLFVGLGFTEATGVTKLTSTVIRLTTGSGTLVIETDDPGVTVTIDGEEVRIQGAGVEQLSLKPGQYKVAAVKDGQPVSQQLVTITRGGKELVRVTVEPNAKGLQQAKSAVSVHSAAADRAAAEYVLSIGGYINLKEEDIERQIVAGTLPQDSFELTGVVLRHNTKVTDAGLGIFKDCRNITSLFLDASVHFTDAGLVNFKDCKNLTQLVLCHTQVSDAGLANFQGCQHVTHLSLWETQMTDAGLANFKECGNLVALHLQNSRVTNNGLAHFKDCRNLTELNLGTTSVSDAGLVYLADLSMLNHLTLTNTKVTEAGAKKLSAALPSCRIEWNGGVIEPPSSGDGWQGWPKAAPPPAIAPFDASQATKHQEAWATYLNVPVEYTNSIGMKFRLIPPGEFTMGSTPEEMKTALKIWAKDARFVEVVNSAFPQHRVILTRPTYFGIHEVTQAEYEQVMGKNPSHFSSRGPGKDAITGMDTTRHPVENVSWNDAIEFCAKLSPQEALRPLYALTDDRKIPQTLDGNGYRLPTEAEWEFACRAGTATKYWIGDKDEDVVPSGWMAINAAGRTHRVGELKANPFGLYDVHGNVWEWTQGWWGITAYRQYQERAAVNPVSHFAGRPLRVTRGGAWSSSPYCPGWFRGALPATMKENAVGIRVVLTVDAVRQSLKRTGPAMATIKMVPADPDSAAAEYVLSIGGTIGVKEVRDVPQSGTAGDSAQGEFELTSVDLTANPMVSDAGLEHFRNCTHLTELRLGNTKVSDAGMVNFNASKHLTILELVDTAVGDEGLAHFQDCKNLTYLNLSYCGRVHDAGLTNFQSCRNLEFLGLAHTEATDAGLANFQDCKELTMLGLEGIPMLSDAGLVHFRNCRKLKTLLLAGTSIGGTGIANFSDCERLEYLDLNGTRVNDAGLANFTNCRHITTLLLNSPEMTNSGLASFQECKDLVVLNINSSQIGNAGLKYFKDCKDLKHLSLVGTQVSDAGLAHLKDCNNLARIRLKDLSVSDEGLDYFMDCKNLEYLELTTAGVSDASLADLASLPNLTELNLEWTRISLRGYGQLKVALPNCHISWSELNRNVAENVLALGGSLEIGVPGQQESHPIKVAADLPDDFFQVRGVSLAGVAKPLHIVQNNLFWLHFPVFDRLEKLDLSGVSGFDYSVLGRIHGLQELSLVKSGLNDKALANLPKLPMLRRLVLDGNIIAGSGMSSLEKQSTLIELSLVSVGLNDQSLTQFPKLPELKRLVLDANEIRGGGIAVLNTQPELIDLSLGCPTLTDLTARQLTELKQIKRLSLAGSSLTDVGIKHLVGLTNLEFLDLRRTNATTTGVNELKAALPKCHIQWDGMPDK